MYKNLKGANRRATSGAKQYAALLGGMMLAGMSLTSLPLQSFASAHPNPHAEQDEQTGEIHQECCARLPARDQVHRGRQNRDQGRLDPHDGEKLPGVTAQTAFGQRVVHHQAIGQIIAVVPSGRGPIQPEPDEGGP